MQPTLQRNIEEAGSFTSQPWDCDLWICLPMACGSNWMVSRSYIRCAPTNRWSPLSEDMIRYVFSAPRAHSDIHLQNLCMRCKWEGHLGRSVDQPFSAAMVHVQIDSKCWNFPKHIEEWPHQQYQYLLINISQNDPSAPGISSNYQILGDSWVISLPFQSFQAKRTAPGLDLEATSCFIEERGTSGRECAVNVWEKKWRFAKYISESTFWRIQASGFGKFSKLWGLIRWAPFEFMQVAGHPRGLHSGKPPFRWPVYKYKWINK